MVVSDLDIGMNDWMCPDLKWDDAYRPDRGKVLSLEEIEKLEKFYRYLDKDGDGITYRTLPGVHPKGAYFTRGSGHTQYGVYTEDSAEYQLVLDRLMKQMGDGEEAPAAGGHRGELRDRHRHRLARQLRRRRPRSARCAQGPGRGAELHARAVLPVRRRRRAIPGDSPHCCSWSSRTATRSSARC